MDMSVEDVDSDSSITPLDMCSTTFPETINALPKKSSAKYEKQYDTFKLWCKEKSVDKISENALLTYMSEKAKVMKSPTLWSIYSMLKACIKVKDDIDINDYKKLSCFLKQQAVGYKAERTKTFSKDELRSFYLEAPDHYHLMNKVALIFGIAGACRTIELVNLTIDSIQDKDSVLIVTVKDPKTNSSRVFLVFNDDEKFGVDYLSMFRTYLSMRPLSCTTRRLFLRYDKGACTSQVVGKNAMGNIPKEIAEYLKLPQPAQYTGYCFRRTSAILSGHKAKRVKYDDDWQSTPATERFSEPLNMSVESTENSFGQSPVVIESRRHEEYTLTTHSGIVIKDCVNCTFNIKIVTHKE